MTTGLYSSHISITRNATVTTVKVFGVLTAFTGVEHGVGEISQGWAPTPAKVFQSWPGVNAFDPLNGEPAMSLVPNLLVSGVLSVLVAVAFGVVALRYPDRPHSARLLLGLSLALLLVGGGFGPPLLGVLTALLARMAHVSPVRRPGPATRLGARLWPWPLLVAAGSFLALVPGTVLLHAAWGTNDPALVALLTVLAFTATAVAVWSARARDLVAHQREPLAQPR